MISANQSTVSLWIWTNERSLLYLVTPSSSGRCFCYRLLTEDRLASLQAADDEGLVGEGRCGDETGVHLRVLVDLASTLGLQECRLLQTPLGLDRLPLRDGVTSTILQKQHKMIKMISPDYSRGLN